ncbi:hypothetical protein [Streptomyces sp. NPDC005533]|uniref:hypothetical protein n=1 Tax=Streptomyces sp. NPDC005533 TaxID=3364723 RepID=UPI0036BD4B72
MLTDVLTGWTAETLGGPHPAAGGRSMGLAPPAPGPGRPRRDPGAPGTTAAGQPVRTYALLGAWAADGQPVHCPSSRPAEVRVTWSGPTGKREQFELTDAVLPDGTYAAERVSVYPERGAL